MFLATVLRTVTALVALADLEDPGHGSLPLHADTHLHDGALTYTPKGVYPPPVIICLSLDPQAFGRWMAHRHDDHPAIPLE